MVEPVAIADRVKEVRRRIDEAASRAGRDAGEVKLVAVTKTRTLDETIEAARSGIEAIGENRVQEALQKHRNWPTDIGTPWHMVGHLQRNKARKALTVFSWVQSISRTELADTLERILEEQDQTLSVLLEVNISGEESKHGVDPWNTKKLAEHVLLECPRLHLEGLMGIAPFTEDEGVLRKAFSGLRELGLELSTETGWKLPVLSMGMSNDYEIAIEEGSNMVRIGTALFGERKYL